MTQWQISLTDPDAPEGKQFVGFLAVEGPEADGVTITYLEALVMGPVPEDAQTPEHLSGRLLQTREDCEAAGCIWPYADDGSVLGLWDGRL